MKNILLVAYAFVAALIGAGFASGQEILCYFAVFGRNGIWGILLAAALFGIFLYAVLSMCVHRGIRDYNEFLNSCGNRRVGAAIKFVSVLFSFAVFSAMLSGVGEVLAPLGIPPRIGSLITAVVFAFALSRNADRLLGLNGIVGLMLTAAVITAAAYMLRYREYHTFSGLVPVLGNGIVYAGYNLISVIPVLVVMSGRLRSRTDAAASAAAASFASFIMMAMIFVLIAIYAGKIPLGELPMVTLARRQNVVFAAIYSVVIIMATLTTLLSAGVSLTQVLHFRNKYITAAGVSMSAYCLSGMGFSRLVNTAYRACGAVSVLLCAYVVIMCLKKQ